MEIKEMSLTDIEQRSLEIEEEMKAEDADIESLTKEVEEMEVRKAELEKEVETRKAEMAEAMKSAVEVEKSEKEERKTMDIKELRNSEAYKQAYANYVLSNYKDDKELRSLFTENNPTAAETDGVYPIPTYLEEKIQTAWENDEIVRRITKTYFKGNLKVSYEKSATAAVVHMEGAEAPAEEQLVLGIVELIPRSIKKWIRISTELYEMGGQAVIDYVYDEIAYQIVKKLAEYALQSIGSNDVPVPILDVSTLGVDTIINALALLSGEVTNPVAIMNRATWGAIKAAQINSNSGLDPFAGVEVIFTDSFTPFASTTLNRFFACVGDLKSIHANFPNGDEVKFIFDEASLAEQDMVKVVGRLLVGVGYVKPNAMVALKKVAGSNS